MLVCHIQIIQMFENDGKKLMGNQWQLNQYESIDNWAQLNVVLASVDNLLSRVVTSNLKLKRHENSDTEKSIMSKRSFWLLTPLIFKQPMVSLSTSCPAWVHPVPEKRAAPAVSQEWNPWISGNIWSRNLVFVTTKYTGGTMQNFPEKTILGWNQGF